MLKSELFIAERRGVSRFRLILILAIVALPLQVMAQDLYVPTPYPSIQAAIDAAGSSDTVIVNPGTYYENINFNGKPITVRSTDPDDPCIVAATIINGSTPADEDNASVVTFNSGENNSSVISGFTITGGTGTWVAVAWRFHEVYWNRCGGGIVCYNLSEPTITKNIIRDNIASEGGGIHIYGDPVTPTAPSDPALHLSPVISENTIQNNNAITSHGYEPPDTVYTLENHGDGGAIVCFQGVDPVITGNTIQGNHADWYGGGIHQRQWSNGLTEDNQIINNDSRLGAGVHITYTSDPTIRKNTIQNNIAGKLASDLGGGGIYIYYRSEPIIEQNLITQNESSNGAGIGVFWESDAIIRNNLIIDNVNGSGVRVKGSSIPVITNNTIVGNKGGVECMTDSIVIIENNIIASNGNSYGIYTSLTLPTAKYNNVWNNVAGNYSTLIGDQTGINGNISVDPYFAGPGDYHLQLSSLCINAGDPAFIAGGLVDYDGDPRQLGQYLDIGADEVWPVWNVTAGSGYDNIQQAIDEADDYDVILLASGIYTGDGNHDIDFGGKPVTVQSVDPKNFDIVSDTIIDSQGSAQAARRGFYFHTGEDANSIISGHK